MLHEACAYLGGISVITMRRLIWRGLIRRHPAFRHILISKAELDAFLARNGKMVVKEKSAPGKKPNFPLSIAGWLKLTSVPSEMTAFTALPRKKRLCFNGLHSVLKRAVPHPFGGKEWQCAFALGGAQ